MKITLLKDGTPYLVDVLEEPNYHQTYTNLDGSPITLTVAEAPAETVVVEETVEETVEEKPSKKRSKK